MGVTTVNGWDVPQILVEVAWAWARTSEFGVVDLRLYLNKAGRRQFCDQFGAGGAARRGFNDAIDALATRLVREWAKEGRITKVAGTRRWRAAESSTAATQPRVREVLAMSPRRHRMAG